MTQSRPETPDTSDGAASRLLPLAISAMSAAVLFYALARTVADPDLLGHVRFGMDILRSGQITRVDPYSYLTAGTPWINHEWLSEVAYGYSFMHFGSPGIVLLKAALGLLLFYLLYLRFRSVGLNSIRSTILVFAALLPLSLWLLRARPQNFTFLAFVVLLLLLVQAETGDIRWLLAAIPLFAVWANLHGGFLAELGILAIWVAFWLLERILERRSPRALLDRQSLAVVGMAALAAAATLLNPYGVELHAFLFRTATVPRPEITEWQPVRVVSAASLLLTPLLLVVALSLVASRRRRTPTTIALLLTALILPFLAVRFIPLSVLLAVTIFAPDIKAAWDRLDQRAQRRGRLAPAAAPAPLAWAAVAVSALAVLMFVTLAIPRIRCISTAPDPSPNALAYPIDPVARLKQADVTGNLAVSFNWGEYVIWHLGPGVQVSVDGRRETVYSGPIYQVNRDFWSGTNDWQALVRDYDTHLALVEANGPARNLMDLMDGWSRVYTDEIAALFVKSGTAAEQALAGANVAPPETGELCFP